MPKDTFFNLPEAKREHIIDIALEEFATNTYKSASLTRIVERAGIAKGSMYQYFENKKDLYLYIIKLAADIKLNTITNSINLSSDDFFELYKELILASSNFDIEKPRYSLVINNGMKEIDNKEIGNMALSLMEMSDNYILEFVKNAQSKGQIRSDIPNDLIAFLISRISISLADYNMKKFNFNYEDIVRKGEKLPISNNELNLILDHIIKVLKNGLAK